MQIIISHVNTDFDALASMVAAKKLYPDAQLVISGNQDILVRQYLNIYRDTFDFVRENEVHWSEVTALILVDVASLKRIGNVANELKKDVHMTVYDHHPTNEGDVEKDAGVVELVGATVTLLIEAMQKHSLSITAFEATLFGLGIYTDTGAFTYKNTTARDLQAASFLMEQGMNLDMIQRFSEQTLHSDQQKILDELFNKSTTHEIDGLAIVVSACEHESFVSGLAIVTNKLLEIKGADAVITVVSMNKSVFVIGRATADRISLLPILEKFGGGGHKHAGSATIKHGDKDAINEKIKNNLELMLAAPVTARDMMASPVKTVLPETTIKEAGDFMYRYGHSGYPVVKEEQLLGIITRRDLDKANHHGLGHAPVKGYMTTNIITIDPAFTLEEVQKVIIDHNIGRLPVVENNKLIGIISRTNIIEAIHNQLAMNEPKEKIYKNNLKEAMREQLPADIFSLLKDIGKTAAETAVTAYLIGGIVRDLFLEQPNDDIDIVVEGDGITFATDLQGKYGGEVIKHESFGTATWNHPTNISIDIASSRLEYYDKPASLPYVETSTLKEDLFRRDFTINAMAICLNKDQFGTLVDNFSGQNDLLKEEITILHNLSFVEDPTRIFRAVRFESRFHFQMDEQTEQLALQSMEKVKYLSAARIINELKRLFRESDPTKTMRRLFELTFWQQFGVKEQTKRASEAHTNRLKRVFEETELLKEKPSWFHYFIIPFYYSGNMNRTKRFALTKRESKLYEEIIYLTSKPFGEITEVGALHRILKTNTTEAILFFLGTESIKNKQQILTYLQSRDSLPTFITGKDLQNIGLKPGPRYSEIFQELTVAILNDKIRSKESALKWVQDFISKERRKSY